MQSNTSTRTGKSELPCNVFVADGKIIPVGDFKYSIENEMDNIRSIGSQVNKQVITQTSITGGVLLRGELVEILKPRVNRLYIFSDDVGTERRTIMEGVTFAAPMPDIPSDTKISLDFVATEIQHG